MVASGASVASSSSKADEGKEEQDSGFLFLAAAIAAGIFLGWAFLQSWKFFHFSEVDKQGFIDYSAKIENVRASLLFWSVFFCSIAFGWNQKMISKVIFAVSAVCILYLVGYLPLVWVDQWRDYFLDKITLWSGVPMANNWVRGVCAVICGVVCLVSFTRQKAKVSKIIFALLCVWIIFLAGLMSVKLSDEHFLTVGKRSIQLCNFLWGKNLEPRDDVESAEKSEDSSSKKTVPKPAKLEVAEKKPSLPDIPKLVDDEDVSLMQLQVIGPNTEQAEMAFMSLVSETWGLKPSKSILVKYRALQQFYATHRSLLEFDEDQVHEERASYLMQGKMIMSRTKPGLVEPLNKSDANEAVLQKLRNFLKTVPYVEK